MATPYLSEIRIFSFGYAPKGWAACNGQLLPINTNQALFSLLSTTYGGDGRTTFGLPNLQGSVPMHTGNGMVQAQKGGEQQHVLTVVEMPSHTHTPVASSIAPNASTPQGNFWPSNTGFTPYGPLSSQMMSPQALGSMGSNQGHQNMAPYTVVNICIALTGIFPSRN